MSNSGDDSANGSKPLNEKANLKDKWNKSKVLAQVIKLAQKRPTDSKLTLELKEISLEIGWDIYSLKQIYTHTIEDFDSEAELGDDEKEFSEILEANVSLKSHAMLPQQLHPILKFADNLGVTHEPVLVALEATASSLIDPNTKIIGRECSNYDQNATIFSAIVGEPGSKKSPLIKAIARKPLREMQNEATNRYEKDCAHYQIELEEWEAADKSNSGDKPEEPKLRVFSTGDYTPEGLRELSQHNPKVLRCFDELARAEIVEKKFIQIAKERAYYQISQVKGILSIMDNSKPSKLFQLHQYALRKGEPITPRDAVYKTKKAKNRGEAIDFFRRLEQMGWGRTITTPRTIKFEAFEERKSPPPERTESTVTGDTSEEVKSHNQAQPSHSNNSGSSAETTATTTSRSQTAVRDRDIEDNVSTVTHVYQQSEVQKISDKQMYPTPPQKFNSVPPSINDFRVGQKVRVDGLHSLVFKIAEIDVEKGLLRDEEGTGFKWQRCQIVEES